MDEQNKIQEEEYIPRPRWQVWLARIGVAVVAIGYILYLLQIANPL